jgi:hypothetical protein
MSNVARDDQTERLGVTLKDEALDNARHIAEVRQISLPESVRRSLAVLAFLTDQQAAGAVIKLQTPDGEIERLHLL